MTRLIPEKGLQLLRQDCLLDIWPDELPPNKAELLCRIKGVHGLLCLLSDKIDKEVIDAAGPQLKVISNYAVGTDNIDVSVAKERGIVVGNTPGVLTEATADLAFALLMAAARRLVKAERYVRTGKWKTWGPKLLLGADVHGTTLGIVGFGRIGQAVARRAAGFNMRVLYHTRSPIPAAVQKKFNAQPVDFERLLCESDFISLHTPLTPETKHLIDAAAFAKMKPTAILINTARGGLVDMDALLQALKGGKIGMAALDVTDPEPIPLDSPLLEMDNVIITPHIGSASRVAREQMSVIAAENLLAGLKGNLLPFDAV